MVIVFSCRKRRGHVLQFSKTSCRIKQRGKTAFARSFVSLQMNFETEWGDFFYFFLKKILFDSLCPIAGAPANLAAFQALSPSESPSFLLPLDARV